MNLYEAKKILNRNGFNLIKEDVSVWPPEGPDLPLGEWDARGEEDANDILETDAEYLNNSIKEKYPDVSVTAFTVVPDDDYEYNDGHYSKIFECVIEFSVPPEVLGLTPDECIGEKRTYDYDLSEQASTQIEEFVKKIYNPEDTEIKYKYTYETVYDAEENLCKLQMSGTYEFSF
jgi:hypothetical protein